MTEYTEQLLTSPAQGTRPTFHADSGWSSYPLLAVLSQVYVPRFLSFLAYLELPLLITVHFALSRRGPDSRPCFTACPSAWCRIRCRISRLECSASSRRWWDTSPPRQPALRRGKSGRDIYSQLFFLFFSPVLLLGTVSSVARRVARLRRSSKLWFLAY